MIALAKHLQIPSEKDLGLAHLPPVLADYLLQMKAKHLPTFEHLLRVAGFCWLIGKFSLNNANAVELRRAGLFHDIGKLSLPTELLDKKNWDPEQDDPIMRRHIGYGYEMLSPIWQLTAYIGERHHRFQKDPYPELANLHPPKGIYHFMWEGIERLAKLLALADCYDALHRDNNRNGLLNGVQIKEKMIQMWSEETDLLIALYEYRIFTTEN